MDTAIVIAALILNPIAKRKRAAQGSEPVNIAEEPTISTSDTGSPSTPEKSDLESGDGPAVSRNLPGACGTRQDVIT